MTGDLMGTLNGPLPGTRMVDDYVRSLGRLAYLWGWAMVNMRNRRLVFEQLPGPGLIDGVVPGSSLGSLAMLHDYISPDQKHVACPNQDVVYGAGILAADKGPSVVQVPDFGGRFWVYQGVDQRTESFVRLGAMYGTAPGFYLLAPEGWEGKVPDGITEVFTYDTSVAILLPRVFMDDTDDDRTAVQPLLAKITMYPLADYNGEMHTRDWTRLPTFPGGGNSGEQETQFVVPEKFFAEFPAVLTEVPPRPGEEALYAWFGSLNEAAERDPHIADVLRETAVD